MENVRACSANPTYSIANSPVHLVRKYLVRCTNHLLISPVADERGSYCNSILQCLYYSIPFREQVINYPKRSPVESITAKTAGLSKLNTNSSTLPNGQSSLSPIKPKTTGPSSARNPGGPVVPQKPEDKESPEYKKKQAMLTGPLLPMSYDNAVSYGMPESLFTSLKDIFEGMVAHQSRTGVVSPTKFLEILRKENEMFRSSMHQDAHEFLNLLLNEVVANVEANSKKVEAEKSMNGYVQEGGFERSLATALPNTTGSRTPSNTGWVHELFEGTLTSETKCLTCENVSQRDEAFLDLSVDLDQHSSVTSCLRKFSEEEMLCERNKFHCDNCGGLQEAEKRMKIKRLPRILALHLKRFKFTEDLQRLQKLFHRVVYPYHLRLFNTTDDAEDPDRLYELYAVVVHIGGGPYHGHYVSIIKTPDRGWLLFDDEMVEPVDKNYVRNFFGDRPGLACAYVLFYQETTLEAVKAEQEAEGLASAAAANTTDITSPPTSKDSPVLSLKTNGLAINGFHALHSPLTHTASPLSASSPPIWDPLDKSATVTIPSTSPLQPLSHAATTPASPTPGFSATPPVKQDILSKKERHKEEKDRKAAEKEQEKADKLRLKRAASRRKEDDKKSSSELKQALDASRASKAEEDASAARDGETSGLTALPPVASAAGGGAGGALNRFRQTSKSISKKPKFWGSKESSAAKEHAGKDEVAFEDAMEAGVAGEGRKMRFSGLRKKTSALLM